MRLLLVLLTLAACKPENITQTCGTEFDGDWQSTDSNDRLIVKGCDARFIKCLQTVTLSPLKNRVVDQNGGLSGNVDLHSYTTNGQSCLQENSDFSCQVYLSADSKVLLMNCDGNGLTLIKK